jgi:hypothetical protein
MAVSCHDYPTASVYLHSYDENELVYGCLDWPAPHVPDPPFPTRIDYPHTPVLVFDGQFDQATPMADARKVSAAWKNSTLVEVANANHVTADGDMDRCTSVILQRFIRTLNDGDRQLQRGTGERRTAGSVGFTELTGTCQPRARHGVRRSSVT